MASPSSPSHWWTPSKDRTKGRSLFPSPQQGEIQEQAAAPHRSIADVLMGAARATAKATAKAGKVIAASPKKVAGALKRKAGSSIAIGLEDLVTLDVSQLSTILEKGIASKGKKTSCTLALVTTLTKTCTLQLV